MPQPRAALDEAHRLDALLSNYKPDSEWSAVNRAAGRRPVTVSAELFALLADCLRYSAESDGAFDITVGPLMRVWGFYKGEGTLPKRGEVEAALRRVGYRHLHLDHCGENGALRSAWPGARSGRHRQGLRGRSHGRRARRARRGHGPHLRIRQQHLRARRAAR